MATTIQTIQKPTRARALDTSGNNNHGQIYSGRALEFDGVTDYLTTTMGSSMDTKSAITLSVWAKVDTAPSGDEYFFTLPEDVAGTNGFGFRADADEFIFDAVTHSENNITSESIKFAFNTDTWYRLVLTYDGTNAKGYANGTLVATDAITLGDGIKHASGEIFLGVFSDEAGTPFAGKMSDAQVWDAAWTAEDALYDYNNPEQLALNRGGTSLTNSNLKVWYPMNDGHRGQQSFILDASNTGLGTDITTNGGFDSDTGWTKGTGWTISGGQAHCDGSQSGNTSFYQDSARISGQTYKVTYTISNYVAGEVNMHLGGNNVGGQSANGDYVHYLVAGSDNDDINMYANSSFNASIDNVVIKPVNQKNHATTVFYGDELVTVAKDKNFDASNNWTVSSANWSIDGNSLDYDGSGGGSSALDQTYPAFVAGRTYEIKFSTSANDTIITIKDGDGSNTLVAETTYTSGTKTATFVAPATTDGLEFTAGGSSAAFAIDWINVKEVGLATGWTDADQQLDIPQTALQSYNQLAWWKDYTASVSYTADEYITIKNDVTTYTAETVSCWFITDSDKEQVLVTGLLDCGANGSVVINGDGEVGKISCSNSAGSGGRAETDTNTWNDGKWHHCVVSIIGDGADGGSGDMFDIYMDGEKQEVTAGVGAYRASAQTLIGARNYDPGSGAVFQYQLTGTITEVSAWSNKFTQTEVNELYNDGKALDLVNEYVGDNLADTFANGTTSTFDTFSSSGNNISVAIDDNASGIQGCVSGTSFNCVTGDRFQFDVDITINSLSGTGADIVFGLASGPSGNGTNRSGTLDVTASGTYSTIITATGTSAETILQINTESNADNKANFSASNIRLRRLPSGYWRNNGLATWTNLVNSGTNDGALTGLNETMLITSGADGSRDSQGFLMNRQRATNSLNLPDEGNSYVDVGTYSGFTFGDASNDSAFSVSAWINVPDLSSLPIIAKAKSSNREWVFVFTSSDELSLYLYDENISKYESMKSDSGFASTDQNTWINVAATYDGTGGSGANGGIKLYRNGVALGMTEVKTDTYVAMEALKANVRIGSWEAGSAYTDGQIDDVLIYNKELVVAEVLRNYNAGKRSHR